MTPTLRNLLVATTIAIAGGVAVYVVKASTTKADLVAAGITDQCTPAEYRCAALVNGVYQERPIDVAECPVDGGSDSSVPDGGYALVVSRQLAQAAASYGLHRLQGQCFRVGTIAWNAFDVNVQSAVTPSCACCARDAGATCLSGDGGTSLAAQWHNVATLGEWTGAGWRPVVCSTVAGTPLTHPDCDGL